MTAPANWIDLGDRDHPEHYARFRSDGSCVPMLRLTVMRLADGAWRVTDSEWAWKATLRTRAEALEAADLRLREVPDGLTRADWCGAWDGDRLRTGVTREELDLAWRVGRAMWIDGGERGRHGRRVAIVERALGLAPVQGELFGGGGM